MPYKIYTCITLKALTILNSLSVQLLAVVLVVLAELAAGHAVHLEAGDTERELLLARRVLRLLILYLLRRR